ncbi:heme-binding domain-containing protein [Pedobacter miscanthi]|uniref:heme-binding domain-containing protein n=1 Tax=Pedobacter miscanthi TaxID=2259170 RepID=UPI00292DD207|nr:heme-binding domain-containing protein [Pedobacter miscanthi]
MTTVKKALTGLLLIMIAAQFYRPAQNSNPSDMPNHISKVVVIPAKVAGILKKACYDCHSNNTKYPWYAQIQPVNWYINKHIEAAKAQLNFGNFKEYTTRKKMSKLRAIENSLEDGTMPITSYTLIHKGAILSEDEKQLVIAWIAALREGLEKNQF